jgi:NADPH-dependent 2,4-dienoyl-CoA reductase/sulfur reductase-like enzyme
MPTDAQARVDVLVLGAGPAGVPAAVAAARAGASVTVIDAAARPGGQYHRQLPAAFGVQAPGALHHGWDAAVAGFVEVATTDHVRFLGGTRVWLAERDADGVTVHTTGAHHASIAARTLILATGATERVLPFPGWDLPGVLTVGAAQALVKGQGVRPGHAVVVAGTGALLLASASTLLRSGTNVREVLDANGPSTWRSGGPRLLAPDKAVEATGYLADLARARVAYRHGQAVVAAEGDGRVERITVADVDTSWQVIDGTARHLDVDAVCVSYGFTPNVGVGTALGCEPTGGGSPALEVDGLQRTSAPNVFAAGEVTGIAGADVAAREGSIAGAAAAHACGYAVDRRTVRRHVRRRDRGRRFAEALQRATPIKDGWMGWMDDATIVCRCEDVAYGTVRTAIDTSRARDARSVKMTTRCGMGWCQAAVCGPNVVDLITAATGSVPADATGLSRRSIAEPVALGEL